MSKETETSLRVVLICSCTILILLTQCSQALFIKRSTGVQNCSRSTPCGWEVYTPFIRTVNYFVASPCQCPAGTRCVRHSDDISISAYVHRCRAEHE